MPSTYAFHIPSSVLVICHSTRMRGGGRGSGSGEDIAFRTPSKEWLSLVHLVFSVCLMCGLVQEFNAETRPGEDAMRRFQPDVMSK
jgi:hypothetical protein